MSKKKHMSIDDRITILTEIKKGTKLKDIAKKIDMDPTSISKEVKKHRYLKERKRGTLYESYCSKCIRVKECNVKNICSSTCKCECKKCLDSTKDVTKICNNFIAKTCKNYNRFPFVCNGCEKISTCHLDHYFYDPKLAQDEYKLVLTESREGIDCNAQEFKHLDEIISDGIKKGKSIYAILLNHPEIKLSERTIYRYIDLRYLQVKNHDLRNKVKMKPRKQYRYKQDEKKKIAKAREGRIYEDYIEFIQKNHQAYVPQIDLVEGQKGDEQMLMTFIFPFSNLMFGRLIPNKKSETIVAEFNKLQKILGIKNFKKIFPAILTDRGGEFIDAEGIENDENGEARTKIFYCNPYSSSEKPEIERNHEFFRYYVPSGETLNGITQEQIELMFSHINSYNREARGDHTPYEYFEFIYGKEILDLLNIKKIPFDEIDLTKMLFRKLKI